MFRKRFGDDNIFFLILGILIAMVSSLVSNDDKIEVKDNSVLVIDLSKPIYDREIQDISSMISTSGIDNNSIGLTEFLQVIDRAKKDNDIKAIMLNVSVFQTNGIATAQEIREILEDFKQTGKKIFAYGDIIDQNHTI